MIRIGEAAEFTSDRQTAVANGQANTADDRLNCFSAGQKRSYRIRRILVSRLRFMGDVILTTPVVTALKQRFPHAEIDYLAEPPYIDLLQHHPALTRLIPFERQCYAELPLLSSLKAQYQLFRQLRQRHYDLVIDLFGIPHSAWLLWLTGAPLRIGGCFRYRSHLYTHCFDPSRGWRTAIDFHFLALRRLGIAEPQTQPRLYLTAAEREWARDYLRQKGIDLKRPTVGLHPGATWPAKRWPPARFTALANRLVTETNANVFLTYGPDEEPIIEEVRKNLRAAVVIGEVLAVRQLAAVLAQFSVYVTNDCGPMHIAPAVGTPTLGIFGPGEPDIWFPYAPADGHAALFKPIDCRPCHQDFCPIQHQCMEWLTVEEVFAAVTTRLERKRMEKLAPNIVE